MLLGNHLVFEEVNLLLIYVLKLVSGRDQTCKIRNTYGDQTCRIPNNTR